jgi:hypothetical protein
MTESPRNVIFDLCAARARIDSLEQERSTVLHLYYSHLVFDLTNAPEVFAERIRRCVHTKILQLPQGCPVGKRLIELDKQFGGLLESKGVWLERWVYEPREKCNGTPE